MANQRKEDKSVSTVIAVVVHQRNLQTDTVLACLKDRPINRVESLWVSCLQSWPRAKRISNGFTKRLASDCADAHCVKCVHDFLGNTVSAIEA